MFGKLFGNDDSSLDISQDDWGSDGSLTGDAESTYKSGGYTSVSQDGGSSIEMTELGDGRVVASDDL